MSESKKVCEFCGKETEELNIIDGHYCCNDCRENKELFIICPKYNDYVYKELAVEVNLSDGTTQLWCPEAAREFAFKCPDCNRMFATDSNVQYRHDGSMICNDCIRNYRRCTRCERYYTTTDDPNGNVCSRCYEEAERERIRNLIHNYGYKPLLNFYGKGTIFMGFELESGNAPSERALRSALDILVKGDKEERFVFKHDGSIPGYGAELVTHPMTLEYHKEFNWKDVFQCLSETGGLETPRGCGLHVHINRNATNNWNWHKIDAFINNYVDFCEMIAGRKSSHYYNYKDVTCFSKKHCMSQEEYRYRCSHQTAVNTNNHSTVEIRIFQATFDVKELYARLEFVHALVKHSSSIKAADVTAKKKSEIDKFVKFVNAHEKEYSNLVEYLSKHYSK